ncbi:uracil-DNA glycosylase family protein [Reichenbachiella versicolor]|uniref:uracil-DNA glycosylase family protein n=1 Tax=Reichenbachiella versicolor TaxID=1821036 RepID=UPI000D6E4941|nr:uracil-DNA glycosylase family protein [Reichenbachiella versicolor]
MKKLIREIQQCTICVNELNHGVNPVLSAHPNSKIAIIGQAPGAEVHRTGIPWDDKSGQRLRDWLGIDNDTFYDEQKIALIPMGFCYPGKGKSGDLPPRKECAPQWHSQIFSSINQIELTILIGSYAQSYYLRNRKKDSLTKTVQNFSEYLPDTIVLPHPSPRNNIWLKKNPWFAEELLPILKNLTSQVLSLQ